MIKKYINNNKSTKGVYIISFWRDMYDKPVHINKLGVMQADHSARNETINIIVENF